MSRRTRRFRDSVYVLTVCTRTVRERIGVKSQSANFFRNNSLSALFFILRNLSATAVLISITNATLLRKRNLACRTGFMRKPHLRSAKALERQRCKQKFAKGTADLKRRLSCTTFSRRCEIDLYNRTLERNTYIHLPDALYESFINK